MEWTWWPINIQNKEFDWDTLSVIFHFHTLFIYVCLYTFLLVLFWPIHFPSYTMFYAFFFSATFCPSNVLFSYFIYLWIFFSTLLMYFLFLWCFPACFYSFLVNMFIRKTPFSSLLSLSGDCNPFPPVMLTSFHVCGQIALLWKIIDLVSSWCI